MNQLGRICELIIFANDNTTCRSIEFAIHITGDSYLELNKGRGDMIYQGPFDSFDDLEDFLLSEYTPGDVKVITL